MKVNNFLPSDVGIVKNNYFFLKKIIPKKSVLATHKKTKPTPTSGGQKISLKIDIKSDLL